MSEPTKFYIFLIGMFAVILGLVLTQLCFSRLKSRHHDLWKELGKPHVVSNNTPSGVFRWMGFLLKGRYKYTEDAVFRRMAQGVLFLQVFVTAWIFLFLLFVL